MSGADDADDGLELLARARPEDHDGARREPAPGFASSRLRVAIALEAMRMVEEGGILGVRRTSTPPMLQGEIGSLPAAELGDSVEQEILQARALLSTDPTDQ